MGDPIVSSGKRALRPVSGGYSAVTYGKARKPVQHDLATGLGSFTVTRAEHAEGFRSGAAARRARLAAERAAAERAATKGPYRADSVASTRDVLHDGLVVSHVASMRSHVRSFGLSDRRDRKR